MRLSALDPGGEVFRGGIIALAPAARKALLGHASAEVGTRDAAATLAATVRDRLAADVGLAITSEHDRGSLAKHAAGTTYIGMCIGGTTRVETTRLPGDRERVRQFSVISALNALRLHLMKNA
jgi:nicotinamide-nucleotide amidase